MSSVVSSPVAPSRSRERILLTALVALAFSISSFGFFAPPAEAIVGGQRATQDYSNMAALLEDGDQICGASLIAPDWVISAAHCVDYLDPTRYSFLIGGVRNVYDEGETIGASKVIVHPNYTDTYDIALFKLERPSVHQPIELAHPVEDRHLWEAGDIARVIGYGGPFFQTPSLDGDLREVDIPVVSDADCDESYDFMYGGIDETVEVCAGELHGTEDSCQGDSGGPLMVPDEADGFVQMGVVSWGFGCGLPTQYGVYARVGDSTLYDWIQGTIDGTIGGGEEEPPPPPPAEMKTVAVEPQGEIAYSNPSGFGLTETELSLVCSMDLATQGLDGWVWELPSELAVPGAVAQVTGEAEIYDLDMAFYGAENGVCTRLDGSATAVVDEEAPVPAGTKFVVATNWLGLDALANLTVDIPLETSTTTLELSSANASEGQFNKDVALQARLTDGAGSGISDQPVRFELLNAEGETVQFAPGSATDTDGMSTATMKLGVPAGDYTLKAVYIGEAGRYTESTDESSFTALVADTATTVSASGNGASKQITVTLTETGSTAPVAGRTVEVFADCELIGTLQTSDSGTATMDAPARYRAATAEFTAVFSGDAGKQRYYGGSSAGPAC